MRNNPDAREPRAPAVAIWTVTGALAGVAGAIVLGTFLVPVLFGAILGLLLGLYLTRTKHVPTDD